MQTALRALVLVVVVSAIAGLYLLIAPEHASAPDSSMQQTNSSTTTSSFSLTSSAFANGASIPKEYTCDGLGTQIPLSISGVPAGTESLMLIMRDPDIPQQIQRTQGISTFIHWVLYGIPADTTSISSSVSLGARGVNSAGTLDYVAPCPPGQYEPKEHRYIITLYALSGPLNFIKAPTSDELTQAASNLIIAKTTLMGRYQRH